MTKPAAYILPVIIFAQFTGTSLWFAGNAVINDLQILWLLPESSLSYITSAVQLGFISGTLIFAYLSIADRFSPRVVFLYCAILGSVANILLLISPQGLSWLLIARFVTGFFLAGIYPVGMKIAAGWYEKGLGRALGYLVGALVLGTALPHLFKASGAEISWQLVLAGTSFLAFIGGLLMYLLVPDGPYLSVAGKFNPRALLDIFKSRRFRASAIGYFGHMWELYTLWAFLPVWLISYAMQTGVSMNIPLWSFVVIAIGFFGCAVGGVVSARVGSARVATVQLAISGLCCILSAYVYTLNVMVFLGFMLIWGISVIGDSPQFSTLNAQNAPKQLVGSALTIVNSIGFLITVISIQLVNLLLPFIDTQFIFWLLIPGPLLGLLAMQSMPPGKD